MQFTFRGSTHQDELPIEVVLGTKQTRRIESQLKNVIDVAT
jgi:hypothetical protein